MTRPGSSHGRAAFALIAVVAATAIGCTASHASPSDMVATSSPTVAPTAGSSPPPTAAASITASAGGAGVESPPDAALAVEGGDPVEGQLGTYVWAGGGSDSPWLPGASIAAAAGETLSVTLTPDLAASAWSAVLAPAASQDGSGRFEAGAGVDTDALVISTPDVGAWTLAVTIRFGDLGSATWFWRLDVS